MSKVPLYGIWGLGLRVEVLGLRIEGSRLRVSETIYDVPITHLQVALDSEPHTLNHTGYLAHKKTPTPLGPP